MPKRMDSNDAGVDQLECRIELGVAHLNICLADIRLVEVTAETRQCLVALGANRLDDRRDLLDKA